MAKYIMRSLKGIVPGDKAPLSPKLLVERTVTTRELADRIASTSSFSSGDVLGLIAMLGEVLTTEMARGNAVVIDGLGRFTAALSIKEGVEPEKEGDEKRRNAQSLEVSRVNLKTDKRLLDELNRLCHPTRERAVEFKPLYKTEGERLGKALEYLEEHGLMNIQGYARLTGLSYSGAQRELRSFRMRGLIGHLGRGAHLLYKKSDTITEGTGNTEI